MVKLWLRQISLLLVSAIVLTACGGGGGGDGAGTAGPSTPDPVTLVSISVSPAAASVAPGAVKQFTATGVYSDGTSQALVGVTWSSSNTVVATVNATGLAAGVAAGSANITAAFGGKSASASLVVTAATLQSITVTPGSTSIAAGLVQQYAVTGVYSDGTSQALTGVTWSSSNTAVATVNATGLATGLTSGSANITAAFGGKSASASLTVTAATLQSITVTPASASIALGLTKQYVATGLFSDGTSQPLTGVSWSSSNSAVAYINPTGVATAGVNSGTTTITASVSGKSGSAALTVTPAVLVSIAITPDSAFTGSVSPAGLLHQLTASAIYTNSPFSVAISPTWSSSDPSVATVDSNGLVSALTPGVTLITATSTGVAGTLSFTVNSATLQSIFIGGPDAGATQQPTFAKRDIRKLTAYGGYSDSTSIVLKSPTWSSSNTAAVTVDLTGTFTAVNAGTAILTASFGGQSATRSITVVNPVAVPTFKLMCNKAMPMTISASSWNAAYTADPNNATQWIVVDPLSCAEYSGVQLAKSPYYIFAAARYSVTEYGPGRTYFTPLTAGDTVLVGRTNGSPGLSTTLYSIIVQ